MTQGIITWVKEGGMSGKPHARLLCSCVFVFRNLLSIARRIIHLLCRISGHFYDSRNFTLALLTIA